MKIHKEGYLIITITIITSILLHLFNEFIFLKINSYFIFYLLLSIELFLLVIVIQFFRVPIRNITYLENEVRCPADGKVVVIEEVFENEYFKDKRIQISIFMSPLNVHANFNPISGIVKYVKYHPGKYLVAWHPKSSTENERSTFVIQHDNGKSILFRQIAGALARRICYYISENQTVKTCSEFGFIKFGSRIDVFLPLDADIKVKLGEKVKGKIDILATI